MNKKIVVCVALFVSTAITGMDVVPLTGRALAWDVIFSDYYVGHESICSFAATCKVNNSYMLATAQKRKTLLPMDALVATSGIMLHKYGSACYYADQKKRSIGLAIFYLDGDEKYTIEGHRFPVLHLLSLPHKPAAFFNKEEKLCWYGCAQFNDKSLHVIRYCANDERLECYCKDVLEDGSIQRRPLALWLQNPCLKAILDTNGKRDEYLTEDRYKVICLDFDLNEVSI